MPCQTGPSILYAELPTDYRASTVVGDSISLEVCDETDPGSGVHARVQGRSVAASAWAAAVWQVRREVGVPEPSIRNWVKPQAAGKPGSAQKDRPIMPKQMEISHLRAENARLKMEMEIARAAASCFARESP